ncbi:MAG: alpha-1,2-fucosyltransferase [Planctomycetota bacterium]|jgi:hypothetical protein
MMNGVVQIGCIGTFGRFGNQLFQYAFARGYAESIGAKLETSPWVGQDLFGLKNDPITAQMPQLSLDEMPTGQTNICLYGYFQYSKCFEFYTLQKLREWFTLDEAIASIYPYQPGVVSAHVRRGDYQTTYKNVFCTVEEAAYVTAIEEHGYSLDDLTWVKEYEPRPCQFPGAEWLTDFMVLFNSDVLFRANSTFSLWAAMLGRAKTVYSPVVEGLRGPQSDVKFIEGNHPRCVDLPNVNDYLIKP